MSSGFHRSAVFLKDVVGFGRLSCMRCCQFTHVSLDLMFSGLSILILDHVPTATAKVLASELPKIGDGDNHVLYPASLKAGDDLGMIPQAQLMMWSVSL